MSGSADRLYTVASLPKPLDAVHGKTQVGAVWSLQGSRKRKRREVAVGVDGESITIHNVQSQSAVTSYALPPQSYLCCLPCSTCSRPPKPAKVERRTYVVLRDGAHDAKRKLVCFTEPSEGSRRLVSDFVAPSKNERKTRNDDIVGLDCVPQGSTDDEGLQYQVLVSYKNGSVVCVSGDLLHTNWEYDNTGRTPSDSYDLEYATVVDPEHARKGLLQNREDVLAQLDSASVLAGSSRLSLLCQIARSKDARYLQIYMVKGSSVDRVHSQTSALTLLVRCSLPADKTPSNQRPLYELHASSGTLYQLVKNSLSVYNLRGISPQTTSRIGGNADPVKSFARLSNYSVLVTYADRACIFETKYGSILQTIPLSQASQIVLESSKRRPSNGEMNAHAVSNIIAFTDIGLAVGITESALVALQIQQRKRVSKRSKRNETRLIDVLGKGALNSGAVQASDVKASKWRVWQEQVDHFVDSNNIRALERFVARDFGVPVETVETNRQTESAGFVSDEAQDGSMDGSVGAADFSELALPLQINAQTVIRRKAIYLLAKCFKYHETGDSIASLKLKVPSWKLLTWLALAGYLSAVYIQQALQMDPRGVIDVEPGSLMRAIRQATTGIDGLELMHDMLDLPIFWEVGEIAQALKLVVQNLQNPVDDGAVKALSARPGTNGDTHMFNGDAESHIESESLVAEWELDRAMTALSSGLETRSKILRLVLARLHAFPQNVVVSALRKTMSNKELLFFIQILRIELAEGGWISQYLDVDDDGVNGHGGPDLPNTIDATEPSDQALRVIGDLLNCAVDAIGINGWLVGLSGEAPLAEGTVSSLRSEISFSLEGCYEANALEAYLSEFERLSGSTQRAVNGKRRRKDAELLKSEDSILPLGARPEAPVSTGRSLKDRVKSKKAQAREKNMRVGKYSIDRIRF